MDNRPPVRGVLLDKDGTIIDCDATWEPVIRRVVADLQPPGLADDLLEAAGLDLETGRFRAGSVWGAGSTGDLVRLWWPDIADEAVPAMCRRIDAIAAAMAPETSVPLVDLPALIDDLDRRDLVVGIATNDSEISLHAIVDRHGLTGRIPHLIGYDSVARAKPHPDMVHAFCEAAGLRPDEVAMVGDNTHDLEMARAAGAGWAVGVLTGNGGRHDLEPHADVILDGIADLLDWLDSHRSGRP